MTVLCRSCNTARIAIKTKVVTEVSEYPLNLETVNLKVSKPANFCSVLTHLRLQQLLFELMCLEQKCCHSFRRSTFEEIRTIYLKNNLAFRKKYHIFPIFTSFHFSLSFIFLVDEHSTWSTATRYLVHTQGKYLKSVHFCTHHSCSDVVQLKLSFTNWVRYFKDCSEIV